MMDVVLASFFQTLAHKPATTAVFCYMSGKGAGTEPLQIVLDLTNTSNFLTACM